MNAHTLDVGNNQDMVDAYALDGRSNCEMCDQDTASREAHPRKSLDADFGMFGGLTILLSGCSPFAAGQTLLV